ncbi:helix-turn-helix domain-containing protein [Streptomyces sp. NPDC002018]|uniref:helix-turn-helix domain-containing protein n=1 Tax=Streptomyces sp. NPDC002018 TaxID=3364629 RepID=UPI00368B00E6
MNTPVRIGPPVPPRPPRNAAARYHSATQDTADHISDFSDRLTALVAQQTYDPGEILTISEQLANLAEDLAASGVGYGRAMGMRNGYLYAHLNLSPERLRKKYSASEVDRRLADHAPVCDAVARSATAGQSHTASGGDDPRSPSRRLIAALLHLHATSGHTQAALAKALSVHPSYVSRLLRGQRPVSWNHVKAICAQSGITADTLQPLYQTAMGSLNPSLLSPGNAPTNFRHYLEGLRLASGNPHDEALLALVKGTVTDTDLRAAFHGPALPEWTVTRRLAAALTSHPEDIKPLWDAARAAPRTQASTVRAEAFG